MRLFLLLLSLPWWTYVLLSGGVGYLGQVVYEKAQTTEAIRAEALELEQPVAVDLSDFDPETHIGLANEVNVTGWIDPEHNYTLVKRTNGVKTSERYLYLMFGSRDRVDTREVKAAIVFDASEKERFLAQVDDFAIGVHEDTYLLNFNGYARRNGNVSSLVSEAIADEGLTKAPGFVYLTPFLTGREAALAPQGAPEKERNVFWMVAAVLLLFGAVRKLARKTTPQRGTDAPDPMEATRAYVPQVPGGANKALDYDYTFKANKRDVPRANTITEDSPLGRLASGAGGTGERRRTAEGWAAQGPIDPREKEAVRVALEAKDRLARSFKRLAIALGVMIGFVYAVGNLSPLLDESTALNVLAGLVAILAILFLPVALVILGVRWTGARFAISAAGGKEVVARGAAMAQGKPKAQPEAWAPPAPTQQARAALDSVTTTPARSQEQPRTGKAETPTSPPRAIGPAYVMAIAPLLIVTLAGAAYFANEKLGVVDVSPLHHLPVWAHLSNAALSERFGVDPSLLKIAKMAAASLVVLVCARLLARLKKGKMSVSQTAQATEKTSPKSPLPETTTPGETITAKVSDGLQGSRAWVRQTARSAPRGAQHIVVDPREKMRDDPFAKLARDARRPV